MIKKIVIALGIIGAIGGGIGFYMFNKPLESTMSMKPDYSFEPSVLLTAFTEDEVAANNKYLDKVIEVKGKVQKVEKADDKLTIYLETENLMSSIIFQMEDAGVECEKGEEVVLKGICTGYLMDVVLVRGVKV